MSEVVVEPYAKDGYTTVQIPDDVPHWVAILESNYHRLVDSIRSSNKSFYDIHKELDQITDIHSIEGNFDSGIFYKNAQQFVNATRRKVCKELAVEGIKLEIPEDDIPESILDDRILNFTKEPHKLSLIKYYQYLINKYAGPKSKDMVLTKAAQDFCHDFGHGNWSYEGDGIPGSPVPSIKLFLEKSFVDSGPVLVGYFTAAAGNSFKPIAGKIDWSYQCRDWMVSYLNNLINILNLSNASSPEMIQAIIQVRTLAETYTKGDSISYSHKVEAFGINFRFRKEKLEVVFKREILMKILDFVRKHHPKLKE